MERINWADPSLSGGLFEKIVGCLLGIEHPASIRVRASQGDRGVDIFIPISEDVIDVHQVKHYPDRLHWTKIQESLRRLADGRWLGRAVRTWYLTVPKQPTRENLAKLDEITGDVPFDTQWFGEDRLTALSARHPEVGDYYLGDGRSRLERLAQDWDSCLTRLGRGESPRIEDAHDSLTEIASALGSNDPHLVYGVEAQPAHQDAAALVRPHAIAMSSCVVGNHVVTCHAYARYRGAEEDAADRLGLRLDLTPEAGARVAEAIAVGGDPVELAPADIVRHQLPAVGHQVHADAEFFARLTPVVDTTPAALRLVLTTAEGERTVSRFTRKSFSRGTKGATSVWVSPRRCFEMTTIAREGQDRLRFSIRLVTNFDGPITDVAGDINLMRALQPATTIGLALDHGPIDTAGATVTLTERLIAPSVVAMLDALRVIQDHTPTIVTIPGEITAKSLIDLVKTAALLDGLPTTGDMRGETTSVTLPKTSLGPDGPQDLFGDHFAFGVSCSAGTQIDLPHQSIELSEELFFVREFRTARVATIDDTDSECATVTLEPGSIPIRIDLRIDRPEDFTDALHRELCEYEAAISADDLVAQLACRGTEPSR